MWNKQIRTLCCSAAVILLMFGSFSCQKKEVSPPPTDPPSATSAPSSSVSSQSQSSRSSELLASTSTSISNAPESTANPATHPTEAKTQGSVYAAPKNIPVVRKGEDYSGGGIPAGVSALYLMDGKLLFTHVTRVIGDKKTKTTTEWYTLFETLQSGQCRALSGELGYIGKSGRTFVYTKEGVNNSNLWTVPWFRNNSTWSHEEPLTGDAARTLLDNPPQVALIHGKLQSYRLQRTGMSVSITLPDAPDEAPLVLNIEPKTVLKNDKAGGLQPLCLGVANETLYLSFSGALDKHYTKELVALPIDGGSPEVLRYDGHSIHVDTSAEPLSDGMLFGTALSKKGTVLLRILTKSHKIEPLLTTKESVWQFIANDTQILYEIPGDKPGVSRKLEARKLK